MGNPRRSRRPPGAVPEQVKHDQYRRRMAQGKNKSAAFREFGIPVYYATRQPLATLFQRERQRPAPPILLLPKGTGLGPHRFDHLSAPAGWVRFPLLPEIVRRFPGPRTSGTLSGSTA